MDFTVHPALNQGNVLLRGHWDRLSFGIEPGVYMTNAILASIYGIPLRFLPSSSHSRTRLRVTDCFTSVRVDLLDDLTDDRNETIILHSCSGVRSIGDETPKTPMTQLTLMSKPIW